MDPDGREVISMSSVVVAAVATTIVWPLLQELGSDLADAGEAIGESITNIADNVRSNLEYKSQVKANVQALTQENNTNKNVGSYTISFESGKKYHGKGPIRRAESSATRIGMQNTDMPIAIDWVPSANDREAFKDEYKRLAKDGGPDEFKNYNKIQSPGRKYFYQDYGYYLD